MKTYDLTNYLAYYYVCAERFIIKNNQQGLYKFISIIANKDPENGLKLSIIYGIEDILKSLIELYPQYLYENGYDLAIKACENGHSNIAMYILKKEEEMALSKGINTGNFDKNGNINKYVLEKLFLPVIKSKNYENIKEFIYYFPSQYNWVNFVDSYRYYFIQEDPTILYIVAKDLNLTDLIDGLKKFIIENTFKRQY